MNIFKNISIINCGIGFSMPKSANVLIEDAYFQRVGTCYDIRDDQYQNTQIDLNNQPKKKLKPSNNFFLEQKQKMVIRSLFNLEILAKIEKDKEKLKKIKYLKQNVFSPNFEESYSNSF